MEGDKIRAVKDREQKMDEFVEVGTPIDDTVDVDKSIDLFMKEDEVPEDEKERIQDILNEVVKNAINFVMKNRKLLMPQGTT
jgi:hypothetical protein